MLDKTGIATKDQVLSCFPKLDALIKAKAIIECYQDIPCNPCQTSCPFGAIVIGEDINVQPKLIVEKCTGCGICVTSCPGLAIMLAKVEVDKCVFKIPYEFLPAPVKGEIWDAVNRAGDFIGEALIENVFIGAKQDKTLLVTVSTASNHLYDFVTIRSHHGK
jgi:Fe-S-cluster-containing hydrogenase component 2